MRLAVCATAVLLTGCASGATFVMHKDLAEVKQSTLDEMKIVIPHIKPVHLKQCQDMLERTGLLGEKYEMGANKLSPNIGLSCVAQGRGSYLALETDRKVVVFTVPMTKVAGMYGTSWTIPVGACAFRMRKGETEITVSRQELKAHMADVCRQI